MLHERKLLYLDPIFTGVNSTHEYTERKKHLYRPGYGYSSELFRSLAFNPVHHYYVSFCFCHSPLKVLGTCRKHIFFPFLPLDFFSIIYRHIVSIHGTAGEQSQPSLGEFRNPVLPACVCVCFSVCSLTCLPFRDSMCPLQLSLPPAALPLCDAISLKSVSFPISL